ncbi:cytochrome-c peroxidase [Flavobacterium sp. SM2513]|uniref:cytochrome-c peroxidase n=1 Tax=Flavobacterium sp. SM2513 TaxID=3424766 RepID=UPI003D7F8EC4
MKKISILIVVIFSCFVLVSLKKSTNEAYSAIASTEKIAKHYSIQFKYFQNQVHKLDSLSQLAQSTKDFKAVQLEVQKTRMVYKEIEFIFDYYQTFYNGTFINGAPLPKVSEYYEEGRVIEPSGLQALDEVVQETEYSESNKAYIKLLTQELKQHVDFVALNHLPLRVKSSQIIECMRSGVVRIFSLGLTGFDTPGSLNALQESYVSLQSIETTFLLFEQEVHWEAREKFKTIQNLFKEGKKQLKSSADFNTFDRMTFLKEVINPLYKELYDFQILNKITEEPFKKHAQNYNATNIFAADFLDTNFYSELVYMPLDNPKTIQLGKLLFDEVQLSNNSILSCTSCHDPKKAFADGLPKSMANANGSFTLRNAPTVINAGYASRYFWDLREYNLEKQVTHVIDNNLEFNTSFATIISKLKASEKYNKMFEEAYQGIDKEAVNERSIGNAIAAYVNSLKSFNSPFDKFVRKEITDYPEDAKRGFNLFMGKAACGSCHFAPMFSGTVPPFYIETESEVLGITQGFNLQNPKLDTDRGRVANGVNIDKQPYFKNAFKTVSIRNVALTAPYMHNGSFNTLEEVMDFYNNGGGAGMGLEVPNQTLSAEPLNLSQKEIKDIIAFMESLSDVEYVNK